MNTETSEWQVMKSHPFTPMSQLAESLYSFLLQNKTKDDHCGNDDNDCKNEEHDRGAQEPLLTGVLLARHSWQGDGRCGWQRGWWSVAEVLTAVGLAVPSTSLDI